MKALSIKQPYAWAILTQGKDIENRTWHTKQRGEIFIHAGKYLHKDAPKHLMNKYIQAFHNGESGTQVGGIVGTVEITDSVESSESLWFHGPIGFELKNPKLCEFIPYKGQLNFFEMKL